MIERAKWTPEPWVVNNRGIGPAGLGASICSPSLGRGVAVCESGPGTADADADRIVACVNACEGIEDPSVVREMVEALREAYKVLRLPSRNMSAADWSRHVNAPVVDAIYDLAAKLEGADQ